MQNSNLMLGLGFKTTNPEELKSHVPALFADHKDPKRSNKYSFVDSANIIAMFAKFGWTPYSAKQNGAGDYARHIIRLQNEEHQLVPFNVDDIRPQIIFDNSHNGSSYAQIHLGLMRKVCSNGLVVSIPGMTENVRFRHMGINYEELKNLLNETSEYYSNIGRHIGIMQNTMLNDVQKENFVVEAFAAREPNKFLMEGGVINATKVLKTVSAEDILVPLRDADKGDSLWNVFNIIQEKFVKGEFTRLSETGRKTAMKGMVNATRGINFNKKLWEVAEGFMTAN